MTKILYLLFTLVTNKLIVWQKYLRQIVPKVKTIRKTFIYECQKHIRYISTLAQQAWKEF